MHPGLLWDDIAAATVAVVESRGFQSPYKFEIQTESLPGFDGDELILEIDSVGIRAENVDRIRRTYEEHRLVEFAAIGVAGLALSAAGRHIIRDVAVRGSSADYLVDESNDLLEIAGQSRKSDLNAALSARIDRLSGRQCPGYFVCVVEFESLTGRLLYRTALAGEIP